MEQYQLNKSVRDHIMAALREIKQNPNVSIASANPALFRPVRSLQDIIVEEMKILEVILKQQNSPEELPEYKLLREMCNLLPDHAKYAVYKKLFPLFLEAAIDDDKKTVKAISYFEPNIVLKEPAAFGVTEVESKKTWRRLKAEKVLVMTQKLELPGMTAFLLSCVDELLEQGEMKADAKSELEEQWIFPPPPKDEKEKKQREEKQKKRDEALQHDYTHGSTLRSNLFLMSIDDDLLPPPTDEKEQEQRKKEEKKRDEVLQQKLQDAKEKRTPVLLRHNNKFKIGGSPNGDGNWTWTDVKHDESIDLNKLPFEKGIILRDDKEEWTPALIRTIKPGHAHVSLNLMELIRTISIDNEVKVTWAKNKDHQWEAKIEHEGERTKQILDSLREILLSEEAVATDYINIKQFLIAAYNAFAWHFSEIENPEVHFHNEDQQEIYAICVEGIITSLLVPEDGKKWCKGIYYVANNFQQLTNPNAEAAMLADGRSIYRDSRSSRGGSGFQFFVNIFGGAWHGGTGPWWREWRLAGASTLENNIKQTRQSFSNLRSECIAKTSVLPGPCNRGA